MHILLDIKPVDPQLGAGGPWGDSKPGAPAGVMPEVFCWTKMGAEAGQALTTILRRKEAERQAGNGLFVWGIGNALSAGIVELRRRCVSPMVVFSEMRSKAKPADANPPSVHLWLSYVGPAGQVMPLPPHCIVTSRGELAKGRLRKTRHYVLFCRRAAQISARGDQTLRFGELRNLVSGKPMGFSQVTALVERTSGDQNDAEGPVYPVTFVAELTRPYFARLAHPVVLPAQRLHELREIATRDIRAEEWSNWAEGVRREAMELATEELGLLFAPS